MVSYANDHLHICKGRCHRCLGTTEDHETNDFKEVFVKIVVGVFVKNPVLKVTKLKS